MKADDKGVLQGDLSDRIRVEILSERLAAGAKVTEAFLAERFGVSRTPVREALKNLEAEGLIELVPNRGAFILGLSDSDLRDLYALRTVVEAQAVRWAVDRHTAADMEGLEESVDFMEFYTERADIKRLRAINATFHKRLFSSAHNRILNDNLTRIQGYIMYSQRVLPYREADLPAILAEHRKIFAAVKAHDPDAAAAAMRKHVANATFRAGI